METVPRYKVGDIVIALEPMTPRRFAGKVQQVFNLPKESGGPYYKIKFFEDGNNFPDDRTFFLFEPYVYEKGELRPKHGKKGKKGEVVFPTYKPEYAIDEIKNHRQHEHGRLPCVYTKNDARRCQITMDYLVYWLGREKPTWEEESCLVVTRLVN